MAARAGTAEAAVADLELRLRESHAREERLIDRCREIERALEDAPTRESDLRRELEHLRAFHMAVERSRPWRFIQLLRRLFGRAW